MKKLIFLLVLASNTLSAQFVLDNSLTIQQLIEEVLVSDGVTISNVDFQGNQNLQVAAYTDASAYLGFTEGLYMTTGRASQINSSAIFNADIEINNNSTDQDLANLINTTQNNINDAVVIEFDFVPNGDSVSFKYVFASEEYPEYTCSGFNDAFGFFLSGPGINGPYTNNAKNIALIPGSNTAVAINTVNNGQNGAFAVPPDPQCIRSNTQYYINNTVGSIPAITSSLPVVYDAFTTILEANSAVQCGQTYHIKLVIGDIFDGAFDSGVFLEANSFNSTNIGLTFDGPSFNLDNNEVYEGCELNLEFTRPPSDTTDTVRIALLWAGLATENVDYEGSVPEIIFPPQIDTFRFPINVILDNITEGEELIEVSLLTTACGGSGFTFEIKLNDAPPLALGIADTIEVSCSDSIRVDPLISGGTSNYVFNWTDALGNTISTDTLSNFLTAADEGTYSITTIDSCSLDTITKSFYLQQERINATASFTLNNPANCLGDTMLIQNTSPTGNQFTWTLDGTEISQEFEPVITFDQLASFTLQLLVTDSTGCLFPDSTNSSHTVSDSAYADFDTEIVCPNKDFTLSSIDQTSGNAYAWSASTGTNSSQATIDLNLPSEGIYQVNLMVTNADGCSDQITKDVEAGNTVIVTADFDVTNNRFCRNDAVTTENNSTNATDYIWFSGNGDTSTLFEPTFSYPDSGNYTITLITSSTEECTNLDTSKVTIFIEEIPVDFETDTLCQFEIYPFTLINNPGIPVNSSIAWSVNNGPVSSTTTTNNASFNTAGDYTITCLVTSPAGCTGSKTSSFNVQKQPIVDFDNSSVCVGSFTSFTNTSIGDITDYFWAFGDGQTSSADNPDHIYWTEGMFDVQLVAFTDYCTSDSTTKTVEAILVPEINLGDDLELCIGETEMIGIPDSVYSLLDFVLWSDSTSGDSVLVSTDLNSISVLAGIGTCRKSDEVLITEKCDVYVPTAFSPNGDGFNDFLNVMNENISSFTMRIFNRWGQELFVTSDFNFGWDGRNNGQPAPIDTYSYVINGVKIDGGNFVASGIFAIVR